METKKIKGYTCPNGKKFVVGNCLHLTQVVHSVCAQTCRIGKDPSVETCGACEQWVSKFQPSLLDRAQNFASAMVSAIVDEPATQETQEKRLALCLSCPHFVASKNLDEFGHCANCGCPANRMTDLQVKAKIRRSSCPQNLWDITVQTAQEVAPSTLDAGSPTTPVQIDAETP